MIAPLHSSGLRQWTCPGLRPLDRLVISLAYAPDPFKPGQGTCELRLAGLHALTLRAVPEAILPKLVKLLPLVDVKRAVLILELEK